MRIGKPLEHAQAAVKSLDIQDSVLKLTTVGRQVGYAGYLVHDMLVWVRPALSHYLAIVVMPEPDPALLAQLHSAKVVSFSPLTYKRIQLRAARLWMTGIACSIVCSIYKLYGLQQREAAVRRAFGGEKVDERKVELKTIRTCVALPRSPPALRRRALVTDLKPGRTSARPQAAGGDEVPARPGQPRHPHPLGHARLPLAQRRRHRPRRHRYVLHGPPQPGQQGARRRKVSGESGRGWARARGPGTAVRSAARARGMVADAR